MLQATSRGQHRACTPPSPRPSLGPCCSRMTRTRCPCRDTVPTDVPAGILPSRGLRSPPGPQSSVVCSHGNDGKATDPTQPGAEGFGDGDGPSSAAALATRGASVRGSGGAWACSCAQPGSAPHPPLSLQKGPRSDLPLPPAGAQGKARAGTPTQSQRGRRVSTALACEAGGPPPP